MSTAYIALGSNLDNPTHQLQQAVSAMNDWPDSTIEAISPVYRSKAVGPGVQGDYLNAVLSLSTTLNPAELLKRLQTQENLQGRVRTVRWGARTLDLDIVLWGAQRISTDTLTIPHPAMAERNFVLYPLANIAAPLTVLPCGNNLATLLARCPRGDLIQTEISLMPASHKPSSETCTDAG
ncbi:MAG: 2-amino-4-hydroxy-6-hydroxymethyldihydropteridine diphosphokinase [Halioglobus sp.]